MGGQVGNFQGANSNQYRIDGQDGSGNAPAVPGCTPNPAVVNAGIAVGPGLDTGNNSGLTNQAYVTNNLPRPDHYLGSSPSGVPPGVVVSPSVVSTVQTGSLSTTEILAGNESSWSWETAQRRFWETAVATANLTAPFLPQQRGTPAETNCPISEA